MLIFFLIRWRQRVFNLFSSRKRISMNREDELRKELERLHRSGLINDEEALQLRKIFPRKTKPPSNFHVFQRLASEVSARQREIQERGGPDYSRDLLKCPNCGLAEDVTFSGMLITYNSAEDYFGVDTGLRFSEPSGGDFKCPACGFVWTPPVEDED
jgi:predicted RNA-binding Zn-ribbon protein involved in translation (DUF1610 family)